MSDSSELVHFSERTGRPLLSFPLPLSLSLLSKEEEEDPATSKSSLSSISISIEAGFFLLLSSQQSFSQWLSLTTLLRRAFGKSLPFLIGWSFCLERCHHRNRNRNRLMGRPRRPWMNYPSRTWGRMFGSWACWRRMADGKLEINGEDQSMFGKVSKTVKNNVRQCARLRYFKSKCVYGDVVVDWWSWYGTKHSEWMNWYSKLKWMYVVTVRYCIKAVFKKYAHGRKKKVASIW